VGIAKKFSFATPDIQQASASASTSNTAFNATLLHLSLPRPFSNPQNPPSRAARRRPVCLPNTPSPSSLHTSLLPWLRLPARVSASPLRGPKQDLVFTCLGNNNSIPSPPVLETSWHGPSSTMLMSFLPTTTILLVLSSAAGRCARGIPSR
jgi:hypothetical protein